jgi:hypothetical protein
VRLKIGDSQTEMSEDDYAYLSVGSYSEGLREIVCSVPAPAPAEDVSTDGDNFLLTEFHPMPWTSNDAERHTHKAITSELQELWAKVANETLDRTGDEGPAIREASAVIARHTEPS